MGKSNKANKTLGLTIIGNHIEKYRALMIVILIFLTFIEVFWSIYWNFDENNINPVIDTMYLISNILLAVFSAGMIVILLLNKKGKIGTKLLAILFHVYGFIILLWATGLCIVDLKIGISPLIYIVTATAVASLFVVEPIFFAALTAISFTSIIVCTIIRQYDFFSGPYAAENIQHFIIFTIIIILIAFRHYRVTKREYIALKEVERLTYNDELTGLLNERSYLNAIEVIDKSIKNNEEKPFAVVLMDVNNLKATNDTYGHRYGCHLVVRTGHTLPTIFKTSQLFHIGGDEFLAIVEGEDFDNFDKVIEEFDNTCRYSIIDFANEKLIFSVARGFSIYQKGDKYSDVLQRADKLMYENKKEIKAAYNLKGR